MKGCTVRACVSGWPRNRRFRNRISTLASTGRVLRYLRHEGGDHARNMAVLGTSDVLESLFGKYKRYTDRGPEATLSSSILVLPVAMETLSTELITEAMERTSNKSLKGWCAETFGRTKLSLQRLLGFAKLATEPA